MDLTLGPLALFVVPGKFCLLMNKKSLYLGYIYVLHDASWTTSGIAGILVLFTFEGGKSCYS